MTTDAGTPTPVLMPLRKAMERAFNLGQTYWQQADHEFTSQHRKADVTMQTFRDLATATCAQHDGSLTAAEAERDAALARVAGLEAGLRFYAEKKHFLLSDEMAWDTVSDEPQNFWCDEAGTATVEDGAIARALLAPSSELQT